MRSFGKWWSKLNKLVGFARGIQVAVVNDWAVVRAAAPLTSNDIVNHGFETGTQSPYFALSQTIFVSSNECSDFLRTVRKACLVYRRQAADGSEDFNAFVSCNQQAYVLLRAGRQRSKPLSALGRRHIWGYYLNVIPAADLFVSTSLRQRCVMFCLCHSLCLQDRRTINFHFCSLTSMGSIFGVNKVQKISRGIIDCII